MSDSRYKETSSFHLENSSTEGLNSSFKTNNSRSIIYLLQEKDLPRAGYEHIQMHSRLGLCSGYCCPISACKNISEQISSECLHFDVSFSIGSLLSQGTFASGVSIWTVSILLPPPHPRRTLSFWNAGAGMSWVLHEIFPNYLIFKGEDAPSFSTLRQSCSEDQWAWPTQSSCVAPLPPLKEKTVSIHSISGYHKLARIQETKSTGKEVGVAEPPSGSQRQPCGTLSGALRRFCLWFSHQLLTPFCSLCFP